MERSSTTCSVVGCQYGRPSIMIVYGADAGNSFRLECHWQLAVGNGGCARDAKYERTDGPLELGLRHGIVGDGGRQAWPHPKAVTPVTPPQLEHKHLSSLRCNDYMQISYYNWHSALMNNLQQVYNK